VLRSSYKLLNKMKNVEQQLMDYIDDQEHYKLTTRNGIIISSPDFDFLKAEFKWPGTEDAYLSVCFYCEKKGFVKILGIKNVQDIYAITPGRLMEMYYEGLAEMVCFVAIEYTYCMSFQKLGHIILAENDRAVKHTVPLFEKLEAPSQFIAYAKQYYQLMESKEN
jgi:hypothetical protein